jgi:hypothetical protein
VRHKGDPVPKTWLDWAGRGLFFCAAPLGFLGTALLGHLVLAFVILMSLGAYPQWSIRASKRRLANSVPRAAAPHRSVPRARQGAVASERDVRPTVLSGPAVVFRSLSTR